jgi:ferritin-like metal-binding protein YciE
MKENQENETTMQTASKRNMSNRGAQDKEMQQNNMQENNMQDTNMDKSNMQNNAMQNNDMQNNARQNNAMQDNNSRDYSRMQGGEVDETIEEGKESLLEKFFVSQLQDIYYAEQQLVKSLPEIAKACTTEELEDAFNDHLAQTERHVKRLEKVFNIIGQEPEGKQCEAMDGLLKEAKKIIAETKKGSMTRDAALIIAAQKVEHYEIASYGGLVQLAVTMDLRRAADLLDKTLNEEEQTDLLLTNIAEGHINMEAEDEGNYSWNKKNKMNKNQLNM